MTGEKRLPSEVVDGLTRPGEVHFVDPNFVEQLREKVAELRAAGHAVNLNCVTVGEKIVGLEVTHYLTCEACRREAEKGAKR